VAAEGGSGERGRHVEEVGQSEGRGSERDMGQRRGVGRQRPGRRACGHHCRATVEGGRVGTARLTGGPGRDGARSLAAGCGVRQRDEAGRRGADMWGRQHSAPDSIFKPNQVYFQRIQICPKL
jgi:hypothetical protein